MNSVGVRPYVWMVCSCGWFSAMSLLTSSLGRERCPWQTLVTARSIIACLIALFVALGRGVPLVAVGPKALWLRSIAGSMSMLTTFYALANLNASMVLTLTMTFPVWVAVLSWPMVGERPSRSVWIAIVVSLIGVTLVLLPHAFEPGKDTTFRWLPALCAIAASVFTAIAMLGLNQLKAIKPLAVVVHFSAVATVFAALTFLFFDRVDGPSGFQTLGSTFRLIGIGVTAMIGQVFLTLAFSSGSATKVSVIGLTQVLMVMFAEALLGMERRIGPLDIVGTVLVMGATGWLLTRDRKAPPAAVPDE
jgi:drug/metabolite transporter (DMT)-like permease